jgi:hypothetical protein
MFSLIITVISIGLVAALAVATMYYGGDTFMQGKPDAEAARYINEGQQISGAIRLYQAEQHGNLPQDLGADLVPVYLKQMPESGVNWGIATDAIIKSVEDTQTCERINIRAGMEDPTPISCDEVSADLTYFCCIPTTP